MYVSRTGLDFIIKDLTSVLILLIADQISLVSDIWVVMPTTMGSRYPPALPPRNSKTIPEREQNTSDTIHVKMGVFNGESNGTRHGRRSHSIDEPAVQTPSMRRSSDQPPTLPQRGSRAPADNTSGITRSRNETACTYTLNISAFMSLVIYWLIFLKRVMP